MKRAEVGYTMVELILVLTIMISMLVLSIQQYYSYKRDADFVQLKSMVDSIFIAMGSYYRAQCFGQVANPQVSDSNINAGALNPNASSPPAVQVPIDINSKLVASGYLTALPRSLLLNSSGGLGTNGFVAQYNQYISGTATLWSLQVAVLLNDTSKASAYAPLLDATCVSSAGSIAGTVTPCRQNTSTSNNNYIVWEKMPSQLPTQGSSTYWTSMPAARSFVQMYRSGNSTLCGS